MASSPICLCGGLQSSGSTLVSWCFLQRQDTDGVLDARFDTLPEIPSPLDVPNPWCKFTISCFRFTDVFDHLIDEGWKPRPLLIVRDVRAIFNSLLTKSYGRNGITADDPPIRLRLRRFRDDYQLFRERGWPMLVFENFVCHPEETLRETCRQMQLAWDPAMVSWTKPLERIADARFGNATFTRTRGQTLIGSVNPALAAVCTHHIPRDDLDWMELEFAEMNAEIGYPAHIPPAAASAHGARRAAPTFEVTRRCERLRRKHRVARKLFGAAQTLRRFWPRSRPRNALQRSSQEA